VVCETGYTHGEADTDRFAVKQAVEYILSQPDGKLPQSDLQWKCLLTRAQRTKQLEDERRKGTEVAKGCPRRGM
jgi:hypothetical protein